MDMADMDLTGVGSYQHLSHVKYPRSAEILKLAKSSAKTWLVVFPSIILPL